VDKRDLAEIPPPAKVRAGMCCAPVQCYLVLKTSLRLSQALHKRQACMRTICSPDRSLPSTLCFVRECNPSEMPHHTYKCGSQNDQRSEVTCISHPDGCWLLVLRAVLVSAAMSSDALAGSCEPNVPHPCGCLSCTACIRITGTSISLSQE
jgi:hypothetical protein